MSDTSRFETALASAESWASIGRRAEAQYWLGTVAKDTATVPQLLRAADVLLRVGDSDLVVVLMERAAAAIRVQEAARARNHRLYQYVIAGEQLGRFVRDAFEYLVEEMRPVAEWVSGPGAALLDGAGASQDDFVAWT